MDHPNPSPMAEHETLETFFDATPDLFEPPNPPKPPIPLKSPPPQTLIPPPTTLRRRRPRYSDESSFLSGVTSRNEAPDSSGVMVSLAGLVIKAVVLQVGILVSAFVVPFRLLEFGFMLVTNPFEAVRRMREFAVRMFDLVVGFVWDSFGKVLKWIGCDRVSGEMALRLALGCFWSVYICVVMSGCLFFAFLGGRVILRSIVEEPILVTSELNFDYTEPHPVALVPVTSCQWGSFEFDGGSKGEDEIGKRCRLIPENHNVQLTILLTLPESDYNQMLGMFQVKAELLTANHTVIASASRPCMLKYKSYPIRILETFFRSGFLLAGYLSESQIVKLKINGFLEKPDPTFYIRVLIKQRAEYKQSRGIPEIYAASVKLESALPLLKRVIWNWRRTTYIWISMSLFIFEVLVILVCCRPLIVPGRTRQNVA